jgi:hypothetical protein
MKDIGLGRGFMVSCSIMFAGLHPSASWVSGFEINPCIDSAS